MRTREEYWEERFASRGRLWGSVPTEAARRAARRCASLNGPLLVPGCGYGRNLGPLLAPGRCVVGLDTSLAALSLAGRAPGALLCRADCRRVPFASGTFAAVVALNILHLLDPGEQDAFLAEALRTLQPGGLLLLNALSTADASLRSLCRVGDGAYLRSDGKVLYPLSDGRLRHLLAGMRVECLQGYREERSEGPEEYLWAVAGRP